MSVAQHARPAQRRPRVSATRPGRPVARRGLGAPGLEHFQRVCGAERGQASLELLALVPLLVAVTLTIAGLLAGHAAREAADQAAVAAAVAQLQGRDPQDAARDASPGWTRARVRISGGRATVAVRPRVPRFAARVIDAERSVVFSTGGSR